MEAAFDPFAKRHASVYANDEFICVRSSAGYRSTIEDRIVALLEPDAGEDEIGSSVLSALDSYRVLSLSELGGVFGLDRVQQRYAEWEQELVAHAEYKSTKRIYRRLRRVSVRLSGTKLSVFASVKDRRNGFEGNGFSVTIDVSEGSVAVGNAVRKALAECA